jgi:serine O-acetyltransferase
VILSVVKNFVIGRPMFENIKADIRRLTDQESGLVVKFGVVFFNLGLHAVLLYRLSRWLYLHHLGPLSVVITYLSSVFTGAQISRGAAIGKGLVIYHPQGTVIGPTAIGDYCTLMQSNVIGQLRGGGDRPIIGDHFYAGAGAKILGSIQIGHHVRVGSNAVVIESLPDGVTAIGVPAKIIDPGEAGRGRVQSDTLT